MSRLFAVENVVDSDDWYTPEWIFAGLGLTFDLDVSAPDGGVPRVPARSHYTVADDGIDDVQRHAWASEKLGRTIESFTQVSKDDLDVLLAALETGAAS